MFKEKVFLLVLIVVLFVVSLSGQSIIVTVPGSGDDFCITGEVGIRWTKTGEMHPRVKIRLFNRSGIKILNIIDNTPNDGSYDWNRIPISVQSGSYVIRVKTLDDLVWDDSEIFIIKDCNSVVQPDTNDDPDEDTNRNNLNIRKPRENERWSYEQNRRVSWNSSGGGSVKLELVQNGVAKGYIYSGLNSGSLQWHIKNYTNGNPIQTGNYKMRITHLSDSSNTDEVNMTILPKNLYYDFVIDSMSKNNRGKLTARVKNKGNKDYSGPMRFRIWDNEERINPDITLPNINVRANALSDEIVFNHSISRTSCGTYVQFMVNPPGSGRINEPDYNNNSIFKEIFLESYNVKLISHLIIGKRGRSTSKTFNRNTHPRVIIKPDMVTNIIKRRGTNNRDGYLEVTLPITVHVKNCGSVQNIRDVWLKLATLRGSGITQVLYYRKPHTIQSGRILPILISPKFLFIRGKEKKYIQFTGGYRQSGGDMSFRQSSPSFVIDLIFQGFEEHF